MKINLLLALLIVSVRASPHGLGLDEQLNDEWNIYKAQYRKTYDGLTEIARRMIWEDNLKFIQQHNLEYDLGKHTYYLGVNEYADMTHEEFKTQYLGSIMPSQNRSGSRFMAPENMPNLPDEVDWREHGFVTDVKDQGRCGSCWAFSATGSLEGQYFRKSRKLVSLSEQQLVDCSRNAGNRGCHGGYMTRAFNYTQEFGIETEEDYPYKGVDSDCHYNSTKIVTRCHGHHDIDSENEDDLAQAVATVGPVSVAIMVRAQTFPFYKGGVFYDPNCSTKEHNHEVLVVGYGKQNNDKFWIVKNSWGSGWGESGYIRMSKDRHNNCGIASMASYPLI